MAAIVSLLIVIVLSILITRIAAVALTHTGLSRESARFQARSAFTGVGFTTSEAESVVNHPLRRRIVRLLMLLGNAGVVTAISTLILTFVKTDPTAKAVRFGVLAGGIALLWAVASSKQVDRWLSGLMDRLLARYTNLEARDYASLLHLAGDYHVGELMCERGDWMEERSLGSLRLRDEGIVVLGITRRDGTYIGVPDGSTRIAAGDSLLVYGRVGAIQSLDQRRAGDRGEQEHEAAVRGQ